jgi:molybdate transport system substrate-binding protein
MLPCISARIALLLTVLLAAAPSMAEQRRIFAAGSLRLALNEIVDKYAQVRGTRFEVLYGPSGKLREKIEQGDVPALFASAAVEHVQTLNDKGLLRSNVQFTRNSMCVMARPGVKLDEAKLVDTLLDAAVKVGTSTPKADPAGDYTWEVFRKIDRMRRGAYRKLDAKVLKLVGSQLSPADNRLPYADLLADGKADVMISFCTNAAAAAKKVAGITWVSFPEALDVPGLYAIGAPKDAGKEADDFIAFLTGAEGKKILFSYGFR